MNESHRIRVLVVDDHVLFRVAVEQTLMAAPDFEVVGQAANGEQAIDLAIRLEPDLILMDILMPEMDGSEATTYIMAKLPDVKVVMLTMADDEESFLHAVRCGVLGYLSKAIEPAAMIRALRAVQRGETAFPRAMMTRLVKEFRGMMRAENGHELAGAVPAETLTRREREVMEMIAQGKTNKEIGGVLSISENTVRSHVQNILAKLNFESRTQAAFHINRRRIAGTGDSNRKTPA